MKKNLQKKQLVPTYSNSILEELDSICSFPASGSGGRGGAGKHPRRASQKIGRRPRSGFRRMRQRGWPEGIGQEDHCVYVTLILFAQRLVVHFLSTWGPFPRSYQRLNSIAGNLVAAILFRLVSREKRDTHHCWVQVRV